jgi:hypothetical protein
MNFYLLYMNRLVLQEKVYYKFTEVLNTRINLELTPK